MSGTKPPNSGDEDYPPDARLQAIYAAIEARLAEFDRCRDDLLAMLQKVCERTPKPSMKSMRGVTSDSTPGVIWRRRRQVQKNE